MFLRQSPALIPTSLSISTVSLQKPRQLVNYISLKRSHSQVLQLTTSRRNHQSNALQTPLRTAELGFRLRGTQDQEPPRHGWRPGKHRQTLGQQGRLDWKTLQVAASILDGLEGNSSRLRHGRVHDSPQSRPTEQHRRLHVWNDMQLL